MKESDFLNQDENSSNLSAMLAAVSATWASGLPFEIIETGIETFMPEEVTQ